MKIKKAPQDKKRNTEAFEIRMRICRGNNENDLKYTDAELLPK